MILPLNFCSKEKSTYSIRRLWNFLVTRKVLHDDFIYYIFNKKTSSPLGDTSNVTVNCFLFLSLPKFERKISFAKTKFFFSEYFKEFEFFKILKVLSLIELGLGFSQKPSLQNFKWYLKKFSNLHTPRSFKNHLSLFLRKAYSSILKIILGLEIQDKNFKKDHGYIENLK